MCGEYDSEGTKTINHAIIKTAVYEFWAVLNSWEQHYRMSPASPIQDLTLELSIHSPSDSEHYFKEMSIDLLGDDDEPSIADDPAHGWINGRRNFSSITNARKAYRRIIGRPTSFIPIYNFSPIPVIKHFRLRRRCRRLFAPSSLIGILQSLPGLERLSIESWRSISDRQELNDRRRKLPHYGCDVRY